MKRGAVIGIDLGTSFCSVGVYHENRVEIITNDEDSGDGGNLASDNCRRTPSWLAFTGTGGRLFGVAARQWAAAKGYPESAVHGMKQRLGQHNSAVTKQSQASSTDGPEEPLTGSATNGREPTTSAYCAEQLIAMLLRRMKQNAEKQLKQKVTSAVIAVPALFTNEQREAIFAAAQIARIRLLRLISEPLATALAFGCCPARPLGSDQHKLLVLDFGGANCTAALVRFADNVFELGVVQTDLKLGGRDLDDRLLEHCLELFERQQPAAAVGIRENRLAMGRLRDGCVQAKHALSFRQSTTLELNALQAGVDFHSQLTRACFEQLTESLLQRVVGLADQAMVAGKADKHTVDCVLLVGGSSRIPRLQLLIEGQLFGRRIVSRAVHPDESVTYGAAMQAALMTAEPPDVNQGLSSLLLVHTTQFKLEIWQTSGCGDTNDQDNNNNEDDISNSGSDNGGDCDNREDNDNTSANGGDQMRCIAQIPAGTPVPARCTVRVSVRPGDQTSLTFKVCEVNESPGAAPPDSTQSMPFLVRNLTPVSGRPGRVKLRVDVDENSIVNLSVTESATGQLHPVTWQQRRLSGQHISQMASDLCTMEDYDSLVSKLLINKNALESKCYQMKRDAMNRLQSASGPTGREDGEEATLSDTLSNVMNVCNNTLDWLYQTPGTIAIRDITTKMIELQKMEQLMSA